MYFRPNGLVAPRVAEEHHVANVIAKVQEERLLGDPSLRHLATVNDLVERILLVDPVAT